MSGAFNERFCSNQVSLKASHSQWHWAWQGFRCPEPYHIPPLRVLGQNTAIERVLLNLLGTWGRRPHGDCRPAPVTQCTASPRMIPWDPFCTGLFSEENPNRIENKEHRRLKEAARSYCTTVASTDTYKTHWQEGVLCFSGFLSGHPGLKHSLSLKNIS